jgi:hypothetical protein
MGENEYEWKMSGGIRKMESGNGREGKEKKVKDNENKIDEHAGEDN